MLSRFLILLPLGLLGLSSAGCGSPAPLELGQVSQAIIGGVTDDADMSVVYIVAKASAGTGFCSGVVVAPRVVLTAAHCSYADAAYTIFLGADYNDAAARAAVENFVEVTENHPHPKWDTKSNMSDIGVLITAAPIPRPAAPLGREPLANDDVGRAIRIVGFGQTQGASKARGRRMEGNNTIAGFDKTLFTVEGTPNICLFDSGGPTFMTRDGVDVVIGIHSTVESKDCTGEGRDVRVDPLVAFVDEHIKATAVTVGADAGEVGAAHEGSSVSPNAATAPGTGASSEGCAIGDVPRSSPWAACGCGLVAFAGVMARRRSKRA